MILTDRHKCLENSINGDSVVAQSKLGPCFVYLIIVSSCTSQILDAAWSHPTGNNLFYFEGYGLQPQTASHLGQVWASLKRVSFWQCGDASLRGSKANIA